MSRRAAAFTEADIARALRAASKARPGQAFSVEILPGGTIRIVPFDRELSPTSTGESRNVPVAAGKDWRL